MKHHSGARARGTWDLVKGVAGNGESKSRHIFPQAYCKGLDLDPANEELQEGAKVARQGLTLEQLSQVTFQHAIKLGTSAVQLQAANDYNLGAASGAAELGGLYSSGWNYSAGLLQMGLKWTIPNVPCPPIPPGDRLGWHMTHGRCPSARIYTW